MVASNPAFEEKVRRDRWGQFSWQGKSMPTVCGGNNNSDPFQTTFHSARDAVDAAFQVESSTGGVNVVKTDDGFMLEPAHVSENVRCELDDCGSGHATVDFRWDTPDDFTILSDDDRVDGSGLEPVRAFLSGRTEGVTVYTVSARGWNSVELSDKVEDCVPSGDTRKVVCANYPVGLDEQDYESLSVSERSRLDDLAVYGGGQFDLDDGVPDGFEGLLESGLVEERVYRGRVVFGRPMDLGVLQPTSRGLNVSLFSRFGDDVSRRRVERRVEAGRRIV